MDDDMRSRLSQVSVRDREGIAVPVDELFALVKLGYLGSSQPGEAIVQHQREMTGRFDQLMAERETSSAASATFEGNLRLLEPLLATDVRILRESYPALVERVVQEVVRAGDRRALLQEWAQNRPAWLSDVAAVEGWIGEVAADLGINSAAIRWFDMAIENGAQPRAYWKVRRLWVAGIKDEAAAIEYLTDVCDDHFTQAIMRENSSDLRREHLDAWVPHTETQTSIRNVLLLDILLDEELTTEVIDAGVKALEERTATAEATRAVEALLRRSAKNDRMLRSRDVADAISLGLQIRDLRRTWGGATGNVVTHVMRAYSLLMDPEKAWKLSQLPPEGEATPAEANDPGIRSVALALMAEAGQVSEAKAMLDDHTDAAIRLQIEAREAEMLLEPERAQALWSEAIQATDDWSEKASLCMRMATRGHVDAFVDELRVDNPEVADEIETIAALFSEKAGAIGRAKSLAATNHRISRVLQMFLVDRGRWPELLAEADQAGQLRNDPDDWLRAALAELRLGKLQEVIDRAGKALQAGGDLWGSRSDAYRMQLEAAFSLQDWKTASAAAIRLMDAQPDAEEPRWALVLVRLNEGEIEDAYRVWSEKRPGPQPKSESEALAWLQLFRLHGSEMANYSEFQEVVDRFNQSQPVRRAAAGALLTAPITESDVRIDLGQLFADLERDFPGQTGIRRLEVDSEHPETIIAQLDELAGGPDDTAQLDEGLANGTIPLGAVAHMTSRNFAETLIVGRESPRFAGTNVADFEAVRDAIGGPVVIDSTALLTLSMLSDSQADLLAESFATKSSARQLIDANLSREALSRNHTGTFIPSSSNAPARFVDADAVELGERRRLIARLIERFRATQRLTEPLTDSPPIAELGDAAGVWTASVNIAVDSGFALWCDDAATRAVARAGGIQAFGTPQVVEYLRSKERAPVSELDAIDATLIHRWIVGIRFRAMPWQLALSLDGFQPRGSAAAIKFGQRSDIEAKVRLLLDGMEHRLDSPTDLSQWSDVGATLVSEAAGNDEAGAQDNRVAFMRTLLSAPWMSQSALPWVVQGAKRASGNSWATVFTTALRSIVGVVAEAQGHEVAVGYFLGLMQGLDEPDRLLGVEVLLTS